MNGHTGQSTGHPRLSSCGIGVAPFAQITGAKQFTGTQSVGGQYEHWSHPFLSLSVIVETPSGHSGFPHLSVEHGPITAFSAS